MSQPGKAPEVEDCEFEWGKKKGVGGKQKEVQFYESFSYDGQEYSLYDNVYLYKDGATEPFIGKLVKIWEQQPEQKKKVKVLWFFRPGEITNWLKDVTTVENELLLASGEGKGLFNINPLEAIAGKCHVVCTSKDTRNPQPSPEELEMADYIFYRTFDVGDCTVLDKIADKIANVEVRDLFNRKGDTQSTGIQKPGIVEKGGNGNAVPTNDSVTPIVNQVPLHGDNLGSERASSPITDTGKDEVSTGRTSFKEEATISSSLSVDKDHDGNFTRKKQRANINNDDLLDNEPSKKAKLDSPVKLSEEPSSSSSVGVDRKKNAQILQKKQKSIASGVDVPQASGMVGNADDKAKPKTVKDSPRLEKASVKKVKFEEKTSNPSNGTLSKGRAAHAPESDHIAEGQMLEVTKRPDNDRSKWFIRLPWEERMKDAVEGGTLVLLDNLDPTYSSSEIEDIVWSGFRESCTAEVVPHTCISSPHSGQAFVIFKSRDAADTAVRKLNEGCLMLPNGRPLVASYGTASDLPVKDPTFEGHIAIDKINFQMQREEQRQALSTSHYSQANTIEYDMAMEWCLLQERSYKMWKELHKRQEAELKKLQDTLKLKSG